MYATSVYLVQVYSFYSECIFVLSIFSHWQIKYKLIQMMNVFFFLEVFVLIIISRDTEIAVDSGHYSSLNSLDFLPLSFKIV